jgi:hypothetical protein
MQKSNNHLSAISLELLLGVQETFVETINTKIGDEHIVILFLSDLSTQSYGPC